MSKKKEIELLKTIIAAGLDEGRLMTVDSITSESGSSPNLAKFALSEFAKNDEASLDIVVYNTRQDKNGAIQVSLDKLESNLDKKKRCSNSQLFSKDIYGLARKNRAEIGAAIHESFYSPYSTSIRDAEKGEKPSVEEFWNGIRYDEKRRKKLEGKCARAKLTKVSMKEVLEENAQKSKKMQGRFTRVPRNKNKNTSAVNQCSISRFFKR